MKAGKGKAKGAAQERLLCKHLSLYVSNGAKADVFWRSAMSGGRATLLAKKGKQAKHSAGDITATAPEGHAWTNKYYMESKAYASLDIVPFLLGLKRGLLWKFWEETCRQSAIHGKLPMLFAKQNGIKTFVVCMPEIRLTTSGTELLQLNCYGGVLIYWLDDLFPLPKPKRSKPCLTLTSG